MNDVHVFDHPLIAHHLTRIRDRTTPAEEFRRRVHALALLTTSFITQRLNSEPCAVETPLGRAEGRRVREGNVAVIPILRAGLAMVEGVLAVLPGAVVGHIGLERDERTHVASDYYCKLPPHLHECTCIILDPMLATGGSASLAISLLKAKGARSILLSALIGAPEGVAAVRAEHPDVPIYLAALDDRLDENKFIVPGLGDAGDRLYGTFN